MGKINLLITNARNYFTEEDRASIQVAGKYAEKFIAKHFNFDYEVDVVVTAPSFLMSTIPEDGISGKTYHSRLIIIVIDKQQVTMSEDVIFETICHEMSHSLRWEKVPEYSDTLFRAMILEGLAVTLEEKAMKDTGRKQKQFFLKTVLETDDAMAQKMLSVLRNSFDSVTYDHERIFYRGDETLPRWAGYRLGYYFVKKHLEKRGETIEQATLASYDDFNHRV